MTIWPERLQLETFLGCNARCTMCTVQEWERDHGEMPDTVFERAVASGAELKEHWQVVSLTMDGEPLMGSKIAARVAACKAAGLPKVGFATNGSLLTGHLGQALLDAGLDWISFSFDSLDAKVYEENRVRLKFQTTLDNIRAFIVNRDAGNFTTRINIRYLDHQHSREAFNEYRAYWQPLLHENDQVHFGRVYNWHPDSATSPDKPLSCPYPLKNIVVLRDGRIPLCCRDYNADFVFGSIMEQSIRDIWLSERWETVRTLHIQEKGGQMDMCRGCDMPDYERGRDLLSVSA